MRRRNTTAAAVLVAVLGTGCGSGFLGLEDYQRDALAWLASWQIAGRAGPAGPEGVQGAPGEPGTGHEGPEGLEGPAGREGPEGPRGTAGADGSDGADGVGCDVDGCTFVGPHCHLIFDNGNPHEAVTGPPMPCGDE